MSRTNYTSETLRLEPSDICTARESGRTNNLHIQATVLSASQGYQKKKVSSFQITSIRPTSRSSNDGADDSENDTEDTSDILDSSRVTFDLDQETPSFSEDYSKSEDILGAGPVIPTSSQYGITALVQQTGTGGMMTARLPQGVTVNVTEGGLALAKADGQPPDDLDNWQTRFKIVKIDSNKPLNKGRWVCLDFMDSPALNASGIKDDEVSIPNLIVSNMIPADNDSTESQNYVQIPLAVSTLAQPIVGNVDSMSSKSNQIPSSQAPPTSSQVPSGAHYTNSGGQPVQVGMQGYFSNSQNSALPSSSGQISQTATPPVQTTNDSIQRIPEVSASSENIVSSSNMSSSEIQSACISQTSNHSQPQQLEKQDQSPNIQGLSLSQQAVNVNNILNSQIVGSSTQSQSNAQTTINSHPSQLSQSVTQETPQNVPPAYQPMLTPSSQQPTSTSQVLNAPICALLNTISSTSMLNQPIQSSGSSLSSGIQTSGEINLIQQIANSPIMTNMTSTHSHRSTLESLPSTHKNDGTGTPTTTASEESESASTASTVAIDNKIEQAMDLVKSHLMFAVREEVDVLKDRIVELMDRITHLECENSVLRQYATPEVLQQLQVQLPHQIQQPSHHSSTS